MGSHSDSLGSVQGISDPYDRLASYPGKRKHLGCSTHARICVYTSGAGREELCVGVCR